MLAAFVLTALAATTTPIVAEQPVAPADKVRCVREQVTGSLVRSVRVCHTSKEWEAIHRDGVSEARRITRQGTMNSFNQ
jgi:hypothetical protein